MKSRFAEAYLDALYTNANKRVASTSRIYHVAVLPQGHREEAELMDSRTAVIG